jgi:hypothetical protein
VGVIDVVAVAVDVVVPSSSLIVVGETQKKTYLWARDATRLEPVCPGVGVGDKDGEMKLAIHHSSCRGVLTVNIDLAKKKRKKMKLTIRDAEVSSPRIHCTRLR